MEDKYIYNNLLQNDGSLFLLIQPLKLNNSPVFSVTPQESVFLSLTQIPTFHHTLILRALSNTVHPVFLLDTGGNQPVKNTLFPSPFL